MIQFRPAAAGASEVAHYILIAASRYGAEVDHVGLQQLLFVAQGWSLADRGRPLFSDDLEAWPLGPVAPGVYREYEQFGMEALPLGEEPDLPEEDKALIGEVVLAHIGEGSASSGWQGRAWREARGNLPPAKPSRRKLKLEAIHDEFDRRAADATAAIDHRLDALTQAGAANAKRRYPGRRLSD